MTLAFVVSTYQRPEQAVRLVRRLLDLPGATVVVHHDQAAPPATWTQLREGLADRDEVVFLPRRVCRYATFDHVSVTLDGVAHLVEQRVDFDHLVLLTGQCYPILARDALTSWFEERRGQSVMEIKPLPHPTWPDGGYNRVDAWLLPVATGRLPAAVAKVLPKRAGWLAIPKPSLLRHRLGGPMRVHLPAGIGALHGGLGYWAMAADHVRYVHEHRQPYERFFRHAYIPDELYFQTVLMDSPYRKAIIDDRVHLVDFRRRGGMSPYVWESADFETIAASGKPFARKFDEQVDAKVLDLIDERLLDDSASR